MSDLPFERSFRGWCGAEGVEWTTVRYSRSERGGETQAHRFTPRGETRGSVLIVHGAGNDALFSLTGLFSELLLRRFEIFSFDVDGHGRSSTTVLSVEAVRSSIPDALREWRNRRPELPLHAVGISLGGSLLLRALADSPTTFSSAVVASAPLRVELSWAGIRRELGPPVLRTLWRERSRFGLTGLLPSFGPFRRGLYPLRLAAQPGAGPFGYVEVVNDLLDSLDLPAAATRIDTPLLLVYGERDLLVPATQGQRLHELLPGSELLLLGGETHLSTPLAPAAQLRLLRWIEQHHPANRPR